MESWSSSWRDAPPAGRWWLPFFHSRGSTLDRYQLVTFQDAAMISDALDRLARSALMPLSWRVRTRRLFLVTLPIALPCWLGWLAVLAGSRVARDFGGPLRTFWSAPPKSRGYRYRRYQHEDDVTLRPDLAASSDGGDGSSVPG